MPPLHLQRATMKKQINRRDRFGILPSVCRVFAEVWLKFSFMSGKKMSFRLIAPDWGNIMASLVKCLFPSCLGIKKGRQDHGMVLFFGAAMNYFSFKKSNSFHKNKRKNLNLLARFELESLESRVTPAEVLVNSLLFRGNLVENNGIFSTPNSAIEVGYNPTLGESFRPLITLNGNTLIDPVSNQFQFQGQATFSGQDAPILFWESASLNTMDVQSLIGGGQSVTGTPFSLGDLVSTATTLSFTNPNGGDTSDSEIKLGGTGTIRFGAENNGTRPGSPLSISNFQWTLSGPGAGIASGSASGTFYAAASPWTIAAANFNSVVVSGVGTTTITGNSIAKIRNEDLAATINGTGLVISNGQLTGLASKLSGSMTIAGSPGTVNGSVIWADANLNFTGTGSISVAAGPKGLFEYSDLQFTIVQNTLSTMTANSSAGIPAVFPLKGLNLFAVQLFSRLGIDASTQKEYLSVTGTIDYSGYNLATKKQRDFTLTFAGDGLVIRDGAIQDWDAQIDGRIDLATKTFEAIAIRLWHKASDNSYGFSGVLSLTLDKNKISFDCGTEENPGILIVDGELRRVDVALSTEDGLLDLGGFTFLINNLGLVYEATEGGGTRTWGLFGALSLNNRSSATLKLGDQGVSAEISLGTRANPGLLITSAWNEEAGEYVSKIDLRDFTFRMAGLYIGPLRISEAEFQWKTDPNNSEITTFKITVVLSFKGVMLGGSITFKDVSDETTKTYSKKVKAFSVKGGADPGANLVDANFPGILIAPGVFLYQIEGIVENLASPDDLIITGIATFSVGPKLPGVVKDNDKIINTKVHTAIVRGQISWSGQKIWGQVDVFVVAYWDEANYKAGNLEPWKPLAGQGTGTFLIDWGNGIYEIKFHATLISLVHGEFHMKINDQGTMVYAMIQVKPTPNGPFDFWPVNKIDASGTALYLSTEERQVIGAWVKVKILGFNWIGGAGYDFVNQDGFLMDSDDVDEFMRWKGEFLEPTASAYKITHPYTVQVPQGAPGVYASRITSTIPFVTSDIIFYPIFTSYKFAAALKAEDILVEIPKGSDTNPLPSGASFTYRVEMGQPNIKGYTAGVIIVDIFANADKKLDYSKTFSMLGVDKLMLDLKIRLKQNSFFYHAGADQNDYMDEIKAVPENFLKGLDLTTWGTATYADATWDSTKKVSVHGLNLPLIPDMSTTVFLADPTIGLTNGQLIRSEVNSFTNETTFAFQANPSLTTQTKGTVSLLVLDDAMVLANRWLVQQAGAWTYETATGYVASGYVVEQNRFSQFEIIANKADLPYAGGAESVGMEVLFFNDSRETVKGAIKAVGTNSVTIEPESGGSVEIPRDRVKPLWAQKAQVMLSNSQQLSTNPGQVFEAANVPTGYAVAQPTGTAKNYYELFNTHSAIRFGNLTKYNDNRISKDWLKLPTLPHFVTDKRSELGENGVDQFFALDASNGITTMEAGSVVPLVGLNGVAATRSSIVGLNQFPSTIGGTMTWSEKGLTPTAKWAYLMIDDGINSPGFSGFSRFTPSVQVTGKTPLHEPDGVATPYSGLTVYIDTNLNGKFDSPEAFNDLNFNGSYDSGEPFVDLNGNSIRDALQELNTVTNDQGIYYFYDVAQGQHTIGFDLPGNNRKPLAGGPASVVIQRGSDALTTVADFTVLMVYPLLKGRVVVDSNQNGKADPNEPGFDQAWVVVTGAGGRTIQSLTDNNGYYSIIVNNEVFGSTLTVSLSGGALDPNVTISSTVPEKGSREITPVDYLNPKVFTSDFFVQANHEFKFDLNASPFQNIFNYFQLFINGQYTGVSVRTGGFEFHVDRFKLLPFEADSQGLETAKGRVVIQGQTLNYELKGPRGLVSNGPKLLELNAVFSGKFNIFGAKLDLENLTVRYVAENTTTGAPARFMLTGTTSLEIDGNRVSVELPGNGLVLSNGGIESLNIKLTAGLKIAGFEIDPSTLAAVYNRTTDKLVLTGSTKLLQFGSKENGNFIGLENVVIELGGVNNLASAKVLRLEATVAAGLSLEGVKFSIDRLIVRYQFEQAALQILGAATLTVGSNMLEVRLPTPGIQIANGLLTVNASAQGQIVIGNYTFNLNNSSIVYGGASLKFAVSANLNAGLNTLAMASGEIVWKAGAVSSVSGQVSGTINLAQTSLVVENLRAQLNTEKDTLNLSGSFKVGLITVSSDPWVRVAGAIGLEAGIVVSASGKAESGKWEPVPGYTIQLNGLNFEYKSQEQLFRLYGSSSASLLGGTVGVSIAEPGLVWRNGAFASFGGGLTGTFPIDLDNNDKNDLELAVENLGFLYEVNPLRLTINGGVKARLEGVILAGGSLRTDSQGIVFGANGLEHFSLFGSIGANFGEPFVDTNKNFIKDTNETYTDTNSNKNYDIGLAFYIADAGLSYSQAQNNLPAKLNLSGMGRLAFDTSAWGMDAGASVSVDLTNPGITIIDGEIKDFSVIVGANFRIGGLDFQPDGSLGLRYLSGPDQWDLFGKVKAKISDVGYGLAFGDSLDNSGIRWVHGVIVRADAAISGKVSLGEFEATLRDAGLTWDMAQSKWGIFGFARVSVGVWLEASLGTRANPGLIIDTSKPILDSWDLNGFSLAFGAVNLGGFKLEETRFGFTKIGDSFSVVATAGLTVNGWGLAGKFAFKDMMVSEIIVESRTMINIPSTPIFINQINGSIRNINFLDLSKLTFSAQVGILVGGQVDLTGVPIIGGKYALVQFFGTAIISASGMRIQADAYLLGKEEGPIGARKWKGLLAQGTAGITLDWSKNEYFADVDLRATDPLNPLFEMRIKGRMFFDGNGLGFTLRAGGTLVLHNLIPVLGEMEIGGVNFYLQIFPAKQQIDITTWFSYLDPFDFFRQKDAGVRWDLWNNRLELLDDKGVKSVLGGDTSNPSSKTGHLEPMTKLAPIQKTGLAGSSGLTRTASVLSAYTYSGQSSPVPETGVINGEYVVHFRVVDPLLRASHLSWMENLSFLVEPEAGTEFEPIAATFDPTTGLGTVGVRVVSLAGQYLPRGMVLKSKLTSAVVLVGTQPELPTYNSEPEMEAFWTRAFEYRGELPAIATDSLGLTIANLNVVRAKYLFLFKPQPDANGQLPADWLQSIRIYVDPLPDTTVQIGVPSYDAEKQLGSVLVTFRPQSGTNYGGKYIPSSLVPRATIHSKVELFGSDDSFGSLVSPDVTASWWAEPSEIEATVVPKTIGTDLVVTKLSGRINDPRITEVQVGLFYSLDKAGELEQQVTLANGDLAVQIPVAVQSDGSWSVDVTWDPSKLPSGNLWLYGLVDDAALWQPIYGVSTPFTMRHDVEGVVTSPLGSINGATVSNPSVNGNPVQVSMSGVRIFADLNNNGKEDTGEPITHSDKNGRYLLDVNGQPSNLSVVFVIPSHYSAGVGFSSRQVVDLSQGPVTANLQLVPNGIVLRGRVKVVGDLGQPAAGVGIIATGSDGSTYRVSSDLQGLFEIPVSKSGDYKVKLDLADAQFYNFRLRALGGSVPIQVQAAFSSPEIIRLGDIEVDSFGLVTVEGDLAQGTLQTLVRQANEGFITSIEFDSSFQGKTLTLTGSTAPLAASYIEFDPKTHFWTVVPPRLPIGPDGKPDDSSLYGPSAFRILDDLRIDGGNLGITLQGDGKFRAFLVRPGVAFGLANLTLSGFASLGDKGQYGISAIPGLASGAGGGGAGLGGAILNQGITKITNVRFVNNGAMGGDGGSALVPAFGMFMRNVSIGGMPMGKGGEQDGLGGEGGGVLAGFAGKPTTATFEYTLSNDQNRVSGNIILVGAGGGGSGLGGAIYNAQGAKLSIEGKTVFESNFSRGGKGGESPDYVTNIANAVAGDGAHNKGVLNSPLDTKGANGSGLGGAIFNEGGNVQLLHSVFHSNFTTDKGAAIFSLGGSMTVESSALYENNSPGDQGMIFSPNSVGGSLVLNNSFLLGTDANGMALITDGITSSGMGNVISSQSGFSGTIISSKIVDRPLSPVTGKVHIPGVNVEFGAPATQTVTFKQDVAQIGKPFSITVSLANADGMGVPTGRVILAWEGNLVAEGNVDQEGIVSLRAPAFKAGKFALDVYYEGDGTFAGNIVHTTIAVGTDNQRTIQALYQNYLGRDAEPFGLQVWTEALNNGKSVSKVVEEIKNSDEAARRGVEGVFRKILGRDPLSEGLTVWTRYLQEGHSIEELKGKVISSREYQKKHTREESIQAIYQNFLGRNAKPTGIENWLNHWKNGMDLAEVIAKIEKSREAKERMVDELYWGVLQREADSQGLKGWTTALDEGLNKNDLEAALFASNEFKR